MAGRPRTHIPLDVYLNGRRVGQLRRESSGAVDFRYDADWLAWDKALPVSLSLPLREDRYLGEPVLAVFENLLPDNTEIRNRLAARTKAAGSDAFSLLGAIGRDCVGALQFVPEGADPGTPAHVAGTRLTDAEIAAILGNLGPAPLGVTMDEAFRISLAGAQEKTALLRWRDQWHLPHGATATTHILKPAIGKLASGLDLSDSVDNEYLCLRLAAAVGLPCARAEIATFDGIRTLVVERFDRLWTSDGRLLRLPQEDGCQALGVMPSRKYESDGGPGIADLLALLEASDQPAEDRRLFLKAQVFFWLLGATDGHAKNFSIHLLSGGRFRLAPLYDILSTQPLVDASRITHRQFRMSMAVGKNRHYAINEIEPRHFEQTALAAGIGKSVVEEVQDELATALPRAFDALAATLPDGFPGKLLDKIAEGVHRRLRKRSTQSEERR